MRSVSRSGIADFAVMTRTGGTVRERSTRRSLGTDQRQKIDAVSTTFPPHEPGRHGWAELLGLEA